MKNFVQPGNQIEVSAPVDVLSGVGVQIGSLFGIASIDALTGVKVNLGVEGVYEVAKLLADVDAVGDKLNWDNTAKHLKKAAGDLASVATVVEAADATKAVVKVKLTPV